MYNPIQAKINSLQNQNTQVLQRKPVSQAVPGFEQLLQQKIQQQQTVKFSKHALDRLASRNIQLSSQELERLDQGFNMASQKGIKETLIMMDNRVFVASVANKTVITATVAEQLKDNVFTNIDGAVFV